MGIISLLSFLGVFAERIDIILPSFFHPALANLRIPYGYQPTAVEYLLILGLFALGLLLFIIAAKLIPVCVCCEGGKSR